MGAEGWSYFVPYQQDIFNALKELHSQVLANGDYFSLGSRSEVIANIEKELEKPLEQQFGYESHQDLELLDELRKDAMTKLRLLRERSEPQTDEEKLNEIMLINGDWGTHSILDVYQVTTEPDFGSVSPLSVEQLVALFGTTKPTRKMVEASDFIPSLMNYRDRWEGIYIILYANEVPSEIWFLGVSGD